MSTLDLVPPATRDALSRRKRDTVLMIGGVFAWVVAPFVIALIALGGAFRATLTAPAESKAQALADGMNAALMYGLLGVVVPGLALGLWAAITHARRGRDRALIADYEAVAPALADAGDLARTAHRLSGGDPTVTDAVQRATWKLHELPQAPPEIVAELRELVATLEKTRDGDIADASNRVRTATELSAPDRARRPQRERS